MTQQGAYWLNSIPQHWKIARLKDVVSCNDEALSDSTPPQSIINYVEISDVNEASGITNISQMPFYDAPSRARRITQKGDVIISTVRTYLKAIARIEKEELIVSTGFAVLRPKRGILSRYLHYTVLGHSMIEEIIKESMGVSYPSIQTGSLVSLPIALPPLSEQERIARYLDEKVANINKSICMKQKEIQLLDELKQSRISEVVSSGMVRNVPMKDSGIPWFGEIPQHWEVKRIKDLFDLGSGLGITKADLEETGVPVISYGQIHAKYNPGTTVDERLIRYVNPSYLETDKSSLVSKGDFIFADTSEDLEGCGNCVYVDKEMQLFAGYHTVILRNKCGHENPYLAYLFQQDNWRAQIRSKVCGVKLFSITKSILQDVKVVLPPLDEQKTIVEFLNKECDSISKKSLMLDEQIKKLQLLKRALINEVVTGKKQIQ